MARPDAGDLVLVRTTLPGKEAARALARRLVDGRLAACVHVLPIASTYRWEGRVHEEGEWLVEARTVPERAGAAGEAMARGHPYGTPLVETVGPVRVGEAYAAWARSETLGGSA